MSSTTISGNAATTYTAHLRQVEAVPGAYHLKITSQFAGAKNPGEQRLVFDITLDRHGLVALRGLIESEVA